MSYLVPVTNLEDVDTIPEAVVLSVDAVGALVLPENVDKLMVVPVVPEAEGDIVLIVADSEVVEAATRSPTTPSRCLGLLVIKTS